MKKWDAIVVGGGIGGLVCGAFLTKAGKKVLILEMRNNIGGRATTTEVMGINLDHGVHNIRAGGHITKALESLNQQLNFRIFDPIFLVYQDKRLIKVPASFADFQNFEYIPTSERGEFMDILEEIKEMPLELTEEYDSITIKDWVAERTKSEAITSFFGFISNMWMTEEDPAKLAAGETLRCTGEALRNGAWVGYPEGTKGFNTIGLAFADIIKKGDSEIRTGFRVREIDIKGQIARGVIAESAEGVFKAEAPIVVSNMPIVNIGQLVSVDNFPRWFVERLYLLDHMLQERSVSALGWTFIAKKLLHNYQCAIAIPASSGASKTGPSSIRWINHPTNIANIAPPGKHVFIYGNTVPRSYANFLRNEKAIYEKEINALAQELWDIFPDFDRESITSSRPGLALWVDSTMKFPGNSWRQRLDVKAPGVEGLYFVGDMVQGWGTGTDTAACSGILCASKILKSEVL